MCVFTHIFNNNNNPYTVFNGPPGRAYVGSVEMIRPDIYSCNPSDCEEIKTTPGNSSCVRFVSAESDTFDYCKVTLYVTESLSYTSGRR